MAVRLRSSGFSSVIAMPWRVAVQRFSFILFMLLAFGLLVIGRVQPTVMNGLRTHTIDTLAPVLDAISRPMNAASNAMAHIHSYLALRAENDELRAANQQVRQWQDAVARLEHENNDLRNLLHFKAEPGLAYISARVIADTGGPFVRGLIVTAGKLDGVRVGMAAMTGDGLIGRVVEAGDWSARVLLITDLNSRIPVMIAGSGERAIMVGDNSVNPKLQFLPQDAAPVAGTQIVTSGHGGIFPPNLPVGAIVEKSGGIYSVVPTAELGRVDYVRLVDFNLNGGVVNPIAARVEAGRIEAPSLKKH